MKIGIVGLGYVGIQLATAFGQKFHTVGFDLDHLKIEQYRLGVDKTGEVILSQFLAAEKAIYPVTRAMARPEAILLRWVTHNRQVPIRSVISTIGIKAALKSEFRSCQWFPCNC